MKLVSAFVLLLALASVAQSLGAQVPSGVQSGTTQTQSVTTQAPAPGSVIEPPPASSAVLTRIAGGDILDINVYGAPDLAQHARVNNAGDVYLPLVDHVHLAGLTIDEAQDLIAAQLKDGNFMVDPHVSITIAESVSGVAVRGYVTKPGVYPVLGSAGLLDILATAGGLQPEASSSLTVIHRDQPDKPVSVVLSSDATKNQAANVPIFQGDTILVPRAGIVYVVGDVLAPAGFAMTSENTVYALKALALAHGPQVDAALSRTFIIRKTPQGEQKEIPVNLKKILRSQAPDVQLQAEDILYIPHSGRKEFAEDALRSSFGLLTGLSIIAMERY